MSGVRIAQLLLLVAMTALLLPGGATPAPAHAGGLSSSTSEARVLAIDPPVPGLDVRAVEFGARLRIENATGDTVIVEPLHGSQLAALPVVAPGAVRLLGRPAGPAAAAGDRPDGDRSAWTVPLRVGTSAASCSANSSGPRPRRRRCGWLGAGRAGRPGRRRRARGGRRLGRVALAAATVVVIGAHLLHVLRLRARSGGPALSAHAAQRRGYALLGWPLGAVGVWLTLRGRRRPAAVRRGRRALRASSSPRSTPSRSSTLSCRSRGVPISTGWWWR